MWCYCLYKLRIDHDYLFQFCMWCHCLYKFHIVHDYLFKFCMWCHSLFKFCIGHDYLLQLCMWRHCLYKFYIEHDFLFKYSIWRHCLYMLYKFQTYIANGFMYISLRQALIQGEATWRWKLCTSTSYPEGNFGRNQLLDGSISLLPLYPALTIDLHVRNFRGFSWSTGSWSWVYYGGFRSCFSNVFLLCFFLLFSVSFLIWVLYGGYCSCFWNITFWPFSILHGR